MSFFKKLFNQKKQSDNYAQSLSRRGLKSTLTPLRTDMELFFEAKDDEWHPSENPNGKFPLNMAENNLMWEVMEEKLHQISVQSTTLPSWVSGYTDMTGDSAFRAVIASFMEEHLCHCPVDPDHIMCAAGATAIIELAAWNLCDSGDVAVIPAPCYPVYTQDIFNKAKVERYDLVTHHDLDSFKDGHPLTLEHTKKTHRRLQSENKNFKLLILTTPDNPTGITYEFDFLKKLASWCKAHKVHLLINELYGLSKIDKNHPQIEMDYAEINDFQSSGALISNQKNDYLHMAYGLSKDFGVSGLRVGLLYSKNEKLREAWNNSAAPHLISNHTQWLMGEILRDSQFVKSYITENQSRLTTSYMEVIGVLKKLNIPYVPARGSLFVWFDLSELMKDNSEAEEQKLWQLIYDETGILLTPGSGFGHTKWGQFRMVHPFVKTEALNVAMKKLKKFIIEKRKSSL